MAFRKSAFLIGTILATSLAAQAQGQSSPSPFTYATRYDADRRVVGTIAPDPDGSGPLHYAAVRNTYNSDGRLIKVEKGELSSWQSEAILPINWSAYNPADGSGFHVLQQIDYTFDQSGHQLTGKTSSSGTDYALTQTSYDLAGRVDCTTERMNGAAFSALPAACSLGIQGSYGPDRITRNTYNTADQLLKVTKAYATSLQQDYATYTYSPNGKQLSVTDANGNLATMTYDGFDREVQWTFPSATTHGAVNAGDFEAYGYDTNGNRTSLRRRDGTTIAFQYDTLNRVIEKDVPASVTGAAAYSVFSGYDNRGLELYARFSSAAGLGITNAYDNVGRLISSTNTMGGVSRTLAHQYDADGNRTRITHPDGHFFSYDYDGLDRPTALWVDGAAVLTTFSYDAAERRAGMTFSGASSNYGYDGVSRLTALSHDLVGTSADQSLGFGYSPASQIVSRTSSNDAFASNTALNVSRTYAVNGLNQYTTAGPASFTYDANGNLKSDGSNSYVYDGENRLVSSSGVNTVNLAYDPNGRLFQTSGGSAGTTQFLYDGDALIGEYDTSGTMNRRYIHGVGADVPLIWYEYPTAGYGRGLFTDHQGSVIAVSDMFGNPVAINAYDAWGIPNAGNQGRFGYTGQAWIPELGMWYYKARIYSPTLGRFLQTDPIGYEDQVNLYAYVGNDPVNNFDPMGLDNCQVQNKDGTLTDVANCTGDKKAPPATPEEQQSAENAIVVTGQRFKNKAPGKSPADLAEMPGEAGGFKGVNGAVYFVPFSKHCLQEQDEKGELTKEDFVGADFGGHPHGTDIVTGVGRDDAVMASMIPTHVAVQIDHDGTRVVQRTGGGSFRVIASGGRWGALGRSGTQQRVNTWNQPATGGAGKAGDKATTPKCGS